VTENDINRKLSLEMAKQLGSDYWYAKLSDRSTSGIPDFALVGRSNTSWWEIKYADPVFKNPGIQKLTCQRLARVGQCCYIVFDVVMQCVYWVHPLNIEDWRNKGNAICASFDYAYVVRFMKEIHEQ
jgi:hypothetical protein